VQLAGAAGAAGRTLIRHKQACNRALHAGDGFGFHLVPAGDSQAAQGPTNESELKAAVDHVVAALNADGSADHVILSSVLGKGASGTVYKVGTRSALRAVPFRVLDWLGGSDRGSAVYL
jgi:hypothetical protein